MTVLYVVESRHNKDYGGGDWEAVGKEGIFLDQYDAAEYSQALRSQAVWSEYRVARYMNLEVIERAIEARKRMGEKS